MSQTTSHFLERNSKSHRRSWRNHTKCFRSVLTTWLGKYQSLSPYIQFTTTPCNTTSYTWRYLQPIRTTNTLISWDLSPLKTRKDELGGSKHTRQPIELDSVVSRIRAYFKRHCATTIAFRSRGSRNIRGNHIMRSTPMEWTDVANAGMTIFPLWQWRLASPASKSTFGQISFKQLRSLIDQIHGSHQLRSRKSDILDIHSEPSWEWC